MVSSVSTMGNREAALQDHIESSIPTELKRQLARATAPAWEAYLIAGASYLALSPRGIGMALIVAVSLFFILRAWSRHRREVVLTYELDDMGKNVVGALQQILEHLAQTSRFWFIAHEEAQTDWKRNAGAAWSVRRSQAAVNQEPMPNVRTNVPVWCIAARKGPRCYFLPDALYVLQKGTYGVVPYNDLEVWDSDTRFIESEQVPRDAEVVGETWQYVNKKGGPDRRFKYNRRIPIVRYGQLRFESNTGLDLDYQVSSLEVTHNVAFAFGTLLDIQRELASVAVTPARDALEPPPGPPPTELDISDVRPVRRTRWPLGRLVYGALLTVTLIMGLAILYNALNVETEKADAFEVLAVDVTIQSDPSNAFVAIRDEIVGRTPVTVKVPSGQDTVYRVTASEPYEYNLYKPFTGTINSTKNEAMSVWLERTTAEEQQAQIIRIQQIKESP